VVVGSYDYTYSAGGDVFVAKLASYTGDVVFP
jgi:hypothetical protein